MKIGLVIEGTEHFFKPIEAELRRRYQVERFVPRFVRAPLVGSRLNDWRLDRQLDRFLRRHDVVFFEWAATLLQRVTTRLEPPRNVVTRLHAIELATTAPEIDWSNVRACILVSHASHRRLCSLAQVPATCRTRVIYNGANLGRFQPVNRQWGFRLGMVASVIPCKRVYEMVLTTYALRKRGYPVTLKIAGAPRADGEGRRYYWAVQHIIDKLKLADAVRLCGYVTKVDGWFRDIDVFVSNSYSEGQQVALLEAMASGCYCLSHWWNGAEEVLPLENLFITEEELQEKLLAYAAKSDDEKRAEQRRLRAIAEERFDERRMIDQIIEVIRDVASHS